MPKKLHPFVKTAMLGGADTRGTARSRVKDSSGPVSGQYNPRSVQKLLWFDNMDVETEGRYRQQAA